MTQARLGLVLLALFGLGSGVAEVGPLLDTVQERYRRVEDLHASFEQESTVASLGRTDHSRGRVTVKRPGRMRWEYTEPEARVIAIDGETLRLYTPSERQLQVAPLVSGSFSPTALDFLLGRGDLRKDFVAEPIEDTTRPERGVRLRPREEGGFDHLELWVVPETGELVESVLVDLFGNRTRIRFTDLRENAGVADGVFSIDVPEGTEVIDLR